MQDTESVRSSVSEVWVPAGKTREVTDGRTADRRAGLILAFHRYSEEVIRGHPRTDGETLRRDVVGDGSC